MNVIFTRYESISKDAFNTWVRYSPEIQPERCIASQAQNALVTLLYETISKRCRFGGLGLVHTSAMCDTTLNAQHPMSVAAPE